MIQDNYKVCYEGFRPPEEFHEVLDQMLGGLLRHAPSDAYLSVLIKMEHQTFVARMKLCSAAGAFFTSARASSLDGVIERLIEQLDRKVRRWQEDRFTSRASLLPVWQSRSWQRNARGGGWCPEPQGTNHNH